MTEFTCKYCDEEFGSQIELLEHEFDQHEEEMNSHSRSQKKKTLNKLKEKKKTARQKHKRMVKLGAVGLVLALVIAAGGFKAAELSGQLAPEKNESIGVGTPVHWHADYNIQVCGQRQILQGGPALAHTHGESTFHLEGVRTSREQATLDWVVDSLGGNLTENGIMGKTQCNGNPAELTVMANGGPVDPENYIIRDGDKISISLTRSN